MNDPNNNTQKNTALKSFIVVLPDVSELYTNSFSELYPWYFNEFTENLKEEIINNLTSLNEKKFNSYLKWLKEKIEQYHVYDPEESFIDKWVKEFKLDVKDYPFDFNIELSKILATRITQDNLDNFKRETARQMQIAFFNHATMLEANKIKKFINELLDTEPSENLISEESTDSNPHPRIFKDAKAYSLFNNLFDEFGNREENLANYSFIFHRMKKDELIFNDVQNLQFVYFLLDLNINIDRIKPLAQIGKKKLRESIYSKAKKNI